MVKIGMFVPTLFHWPLESQWDKENYLQKIECVNCVCICVTVILMFQFMCNFNYYLDTVAHATLFAFHLVVLL